MDKKEPDVKVETKSPDPCDVCGETGNHTHSQDAHRAHLDSMPWPPDTRGR